MSTNRERRAATAGHPAHGPNDHQVEQIIGRLLQVGVLLAAVITIAGAILLIAQYGGDRADYTVFGGVEAALRGVGGIVRAALALDSRAIVQLGIVTLIATPIARVALTLVAFLVRRDWLYVALTGVVLAILLYSIVWGRA